jgi:hypothetical protein
MKIHVLAAMRGVSAFLLCAAGSVGPAAADWLQCAATGTGAAGRFSYQTLVVDVGAVSPQRLTEFQSRLTDYVKKDSASAHDVQAQCAQFDDSGPAANRFSRAFQDASRAYGWDHVTVVQPESWLASKDILNQPTYP